MKTAWQSLVLCSLAVSSSTLIVWGTENDRATASANDSTVRLQSDPPDPSADDANDSPYQAGQRARGGAGVYKGQITPHWIGQGGSFWYRNDVARGASEYVLVDSVKGTRAPAFDHTRLGEALVAAGLTDVRSDRLSLTALEFDLAKNRLEFNAGGKSWRSDLATGEISKIDSRSGDSEERLAPVAEGNAPRASLRNGGETELTFVNKTSGEVELFWLDGEGQRRSYGKVAPGQQHVQHTFAGHVWEIVGQDGKRIAVFEAEERPATAEIAVGQPQRPRLRRAGEGANRPGGRDTSPDGKWLALIKEHNLFIRPVGGGDEVQLSSDGTAGRAYGMFSWSPDSTSLAAFRIEPGEEREVYLVESSPRGGGRAVLHKRPYPLPGDRFTSYELNLFDVAGSKQSKPEVGPIDFGIPRLHWKREGHVFSYEKTDRGHQRFRLIEVDAQTGAARNLIDEQSQTFIWSAHMEGLNLRAVTWLDKTNEIVHVSERDGWRHLYLIDAATGSVKNQITRGEWVVRGVDLIDEDLRQIWFRASGMNADQDPYFIQHFRINFDGTGLVALTAGDGNHAIQFSPDRKFVIDTYSRVDLPPTNAFRRTVDGSLVCELEQADVRELTERGWTPPEVFTAKGRDGKTDIWGIICRPRNFDPARKYPVIESIYAGPQGSYVPKSFSAERRFSSLTDLGFIVVQIDGMGTANRSKAFHDVCWHNLMDAGLPDRVLWHKAVAAKYPYYDISRVGIYGGSAGGQNSTGAVLFHPDFYKVAVSGCGCHDNRMDKASWNEQWMGYPVGPHYAECSNIDNAHRLRGRLMLIVGEMDNNVPTESTYRLADALIKAGKDFDLVVVPGAGHGMGGPYGQRRMNDFFVRHLLETEPPDRNAGREASAPRNGPGRAVASASIALPEEVPAPERRSPEPLNLIELNSGQTGLAGIIERYSADRGSVQRNLPASLASRAPRLKEFDDDWLARLATLEFDSLSQQGKVDYVLLKNQIRTNLRQLELRTRSETEIAPLVPFAGTITGLDEARRRLDAMEWSKVAGTVNDLVKQIGEARRALDSLPKDSKSSKVLANRAVQAVETLRGTLRNWHAFYGGYDPLFTWWVDDPYKSADQALQTYATAIRRHFFGNAAPAEVQTTGDGTNRGNDSRRRDGSDIVGSPIGREALLSELASEMIAYSPEELVAIAEKEFNWCEAELKKTSRDMGLEDDWRSALERVKTLHVEPGKQPELIRQLALEAIEFVDKRDLVTVPQLCRDSWRMAMMTPERQMVNPFFTGGETISVSFPTNSMPHEAKLMSLRGNNIHFARATVQHELIPGHHLQGYMNARHKTYRELFRTPFWIEGWALYWEMLLWDLDFPQSPENRIGMLFWRMHRCSRIVFSLKFHLEQMTAQECIDYLVQRGGHERDNASAEVRRSFETSYAPLYQAAYMLGGLQFRSLHRDLVDSGRMTNRQFHDAILKENCIPVDMVRAVLTERPLTRDYETDWRFYGFAP